MHAIQQPPVDRLEAVTHVGQGSGHDDRHGVVQEGSLHLVLDLDGLDPDQGAATVTVAAFSAVLARPILAGRRCGIAHMSRNLTSLALVWMKCFRNSTSSPIKMAVT